MALQVVFLDKLSRYLTIMSQNRPNIYSANDVFRLTSNLKEGHCSGIVSLWLYYKLRRKEKYFYDSIMAPIFNWDGREETLTKELKDILEYALSCVLWLQAEDSFGVAQKKTDIQQSDSDILIGLIKQNDYPTLKKEYEIAFVFTNDELVEFLEDIPTNKLIRLASGDHALGLYYDGEEQEIILFDPNGFPDEKTHEVFFEKRFALNEMQDLVKTLQVSFREPGSDVMGLTISIFDDAQNPIPDYFDREETIKKILNSRIKNEEKIDIDKTSLYDDSSSLYLAAKQGHSDIVRLLLSQGANVGKLKHDLWCPIHIASQNGHVDVIEALLSSQEGRDTIDFPLEDGSTPLYIAAKEGHLEVVKLLLKHGADDFS